MITKISKETVKLVDKKSSRSNKSKSSEMRPFKASSVKFKRRRYLKTFSLVSLTLMLVIVFKQEQLQLQQQQQQQQQVSGSKIIQFANAMVTPGTIKASSQSQSSSSSSLNMNEIDANCSLNDDNDDCIDYIIRPESDLMRSRLVASGRTSLLGDREKREKVLDFTDNLYNPVIFIPGDGGSQLEARLNKTYRVRYICAQQSDWYDIWLNLHLLAPIVIDCLYDNLRLHYDITSRSTKNTEGVEIRVRQFGSCESVSYLDVLHMPKTDYFEKIISTLEKQNGLIRDIDMQGAAFDFRKAPNELEEFFFNLTQLIENLHYRSNKQVTLICHSMGCLNAVYLLNSKSNQWKEIHVKRLITLGSPWDGSFKAISAMLFGDNLGIPLLDHKKLRVLQASFPSLMYLFPKEPGFSRDRILVEGPTINYTISNLDQLFAETNLTDQQEMWHDTRKISRNLKAPNVELWCLYGSGISTPSMIKVDSELYDAIDNWKYNEIDGDGDGTVNLESLQACKLFANQQTKPVYVREFEGIDHIEILRGDIIGEFISKEILSRDRIENLQKQSSVQL